jgi:DUF2975 family protein
MKTYLTTHNEAKLRRIQKTSLVLRGGCTALMVIAVIITIVASVGMGSGRVSSATNFSQSIPLAELTRSGRLMVFAAAWLASAAIIKALYHLRRLLGCYSRAEIFTSDSAAQIRQFGITCVLWGAVKILWAFLPVMILSNPPHATSIQIDTIVIGGVIVAISWFADMAAELREENDLTI